MFKKLFIASIAASLLLSIPVIADRHDRGHDRHCDKVKEKIAEVKAQEKSFGTKTVNGTLQFFNSTATLWSCLASVVIAYYAPVPASLQSLDPKVAKAIEATVSFAIIYPIIKYGTAAGMSQEDVKPLSK